MIKKIFAVILIILTNQFIKAQIPEKIEPFNTPFGKFNFQRPEFPDAKVNIIDFGAQEGGEFKNTSAINKAIKKLSKSGGGTVVVLSFYHQLSGLTW